MFGNLLNGISEFAENPLKKTADLVTQPVRDALTVIDGLTEGELREKAAIRLGMDVAAGMALSELIDWYQED